MVYKKINNLLILIIGGALIVLLQVALSVHASQYEGTDDQSVEVIQKIAPDYTPWVSTVWEHQQPWYENLVFAFQLAIGLGVILFYLYNQHKKTLNSR
jgi:cobalt/nickel transport protein